MDKKTAIDKIRKCLALSKSAEPHEAAAAMRQAQKAMDGRAELIRCPTLITAAENDPLAAGAQAFFDALRCPKELIRFSAAEESLRDVQSLAPEPPSAVLARYRAGVSPALSRSALLPPTVAATPGARPWS